MRYRYPHLGTIEVQNYSNDYCPSCKLLDSSLPSFIYARKTLFQRHAALLVANNAVCLISGFDLRI